MRYSNEDIIAIMRQRYVAEKAANARQQARGKPMPAALSDKSLINLSKRGCGYDDGDSGMAFDFEAFKRNLS